MIQRKAIDSDIPAIIELLKISLGESLIPKSEKLWKWKHIENPFGKSPILLAEENGILLGVRAFLKWEYYLDGKVYKACRAVDTATHPDHQGRGIFKNLSLSLIEEIKKDDVDLVFNTPNSKSTPGYLKMGWEKWGKLPLKLNFHLTNIKGSQQEFGDWNQITSLIEKIEHASQSDPVMQTRLVPGYLHWRYPANPLYTYQFISDGENFLLIYRIKEGKMGKEFRICDFFTTDLLSDAKSKSIKKLLNERIKSSGTRFSSFSGLSYPLQNYIDMGPIPILKIGPMVTLRKTTEDLDPKSLAWAWSLGDLEVF